MLWPPPEEEQFTVMNRAYFIGMTAGCIASAGVGVSLTQGTGGKRSLWIWRTPLAEAGDIAAFAQRNHFYTLFLSVSLEDRSALEAGDANALDALRALKRAGLVVYGVAGDAAWVERHRTEPPAGVQKLLDVHRVHGIFDGLALDIEPHTLAGWKDGSQKDTLAANYLQLLVLIHSAAVALSLPALATVHPTYAKYSPPAANGETLLQSAARAVDATDLMAYRNAENALESFGGAAMGQLAALAKPWWLGVSTHAESAPGTSYATLPAAQFFPSIDATAATLERRYGRSFAGISVENYRNTLTLLGAAAAK